VCVWVCVCVVVRMLVCVCSSGVPHVSSRTLN
jgi:hypothetical protein